MVEFAPAAPIAVRITSPWNSHAWFVTPEPVVRAAEPSRIAADVLPAEPPRHVNVNVGVPVVDKIPRWQ